MPDRLKLAERIQAGCLIVEVIGEFTGTQCARIINTVRHGVGPGISRAVLDLRRLEHMSASSLAELAETHRILADAGCRLVLACPNTQVRKLLILSFLDKLIETADSVEKAIADASGGETASASGKRSDA
jgi:anti-anti-sigma factor